MAGREERLTPATRNYVIFGLLFVIAIGLAIRDWTDPRQRRGQSDSAVRLLLVSDHAVEPGLLLAEHDGFRITPIDAATLEAEGRALVGDEPAPYQAALAYADELGFGFVAFDMTGQNGERWGLRAGEPGIEQLPPGSAQFAVFSVGDVAIAGPRMHSVALADGIVLDPRLARLDSLRRSIYEHPDFGRLWTIEPNATEVQALRVFDSRKIPERRELLIRDHQDWQRLAGTWPGPERVPGSLPLPTRPPPSLPSSTRPPPILAGAWERVQAAPIPGGLLLEIRPVRVHVDVYRNTSIELDPAATLAFLPATASSDPAARRPCAGLPEQLGEAAQVAVAPDGSALVIGGVEDRSEVFVFEHGASEGEVQCRARSVAVLPTGEHAIGRPHASGAMAWNYDDWLHWWADGQEQRVRIEGAIAFSGPWWVHAELLALIGERPLVGGQGPLAELGYEPALVLLATTPGPELAGDWPRVELGAAELFPAAGPEAEPPTLLDLRPAGPEALLLTTERCPESAYDDERPCLHRVSAAVPLAELATGSLTLAETLIVETLGPLDPHVELAVAADGSRVAWIDRASRSLWVADLRGRNRMVPRRLDGEPTPDASLRISADGRTVLSEISVEFVLRDEVIGAVSIPRMFALEPAPTDAVAPESAAQ